MLKPRRFRKFKKTAVHAVAAQSVPLEAIDSEELKRYAQEQKARMDGYKVGALDNSGNRIVKVFSRGDDFLIYEIEGVSESESFKVLVDTVIDADPNGYIQRFEKIKPSIDDFRSILYKGVHDKSVKHRAASAISTALRGDIDGAKAIFEKIKSQVLEEYKNVSDGRFNYLGSSFAAMIVLLVIAGVFYCQRDSDFLIKNPLVKYFMYSAAFAAIGGFLSVCINLKDIEFERSLEWWKYEAYGVQRIVLAAICGVISYLLIASDILLSFMAKSPSAGLAIMAICVLSGFSEKLIPNTLRRLESKEDQSDK
jgi:hypothetical protein